MQNKEETQKNVKAYKIIRANIFLRKTTTSLAITTKIGLDYQRKNHS